MANARGRPKAPLILSPDERLYLETGTPPSCGRSLSERCRVILRCADGMPSKTIARELGLHEHTVGKWRRRFLKGRNDGLLDEARPGRPRTITTIRLLASLKRTVRLAPADATHWSICSSWNLIGQLASGGWSVSPV